MVVQGFSPTANLSWISLQFYVLVSHSFHVVESVLSFATLSLFNDQFNYQSAHISPKYLLLLSSPNPCTSQTLHQSQDFYNSLALFFQSQRNVNRQSYHKSCKLSPNEVCHYRLTELLCIRVCVLILCWILKWTIAFSCDVLGFRFQSLFTSPLLSNFLDKTFVSSAFQSIYSAYLILYALYIVY